MTDFRYMCELCCESFVSDTKQEREAVGDFAGDFPLEDIKTAAKVCTPCFEIIMADIKARPTH